jgi:succinoglycan biosynthesis protein ExoO
MIVGSDNRHNREGLNWLIGSEKHLSPISLRIYGSLASRLKSAGVLELYPRYASPVAPYKENGIVLMTTSHGTGIQIKAIEALACGRAIIARRGAMRGMPDGDGTWLEVDEPEEMVNAAKLLVQDPIRRIDLMKRSSHYYKEHFESNKIVKSLLDRYKDL